MKISWLGGDWNAGAVDLRKIYSGEFAEIPWKSVSFVIFFLRRDVKKNFFYCLIVLNDRDEKRDEMRMKKGKNSSSLFYDYLSDKYDGSWE